MGQAPGGPPNVLLDTCGAGSAFVDEVVTHTQAANVADFIGPADGEIRVRVQAFNPGNALNAAWVARIDQCSVIANQQARAGSPRTEMKAGTRWCAGRIWFLKVRERAPAGGSAGREWPGIE